ncbi:ABC-type transport system involved in multi-copper enzyme maturation, permease component [Beggiatoa alba B18LD]|uniref:ABC-type transport system involved in multi-copper enzyme maturation, permease component n=1 Tax=Beggiatoa alba B18LD TaxID=395493 RepID=I3CFU3_9GAMM|nr:ABC transporter permease subunit [Beggiatoa alba]EIJ42486.1 ABC-type transport system involved in multi-copper enzyme maturation, permease component [Beggiatoa alba B18LD]
MGKACYDELLSPYTTTGLPISQRSAIHQPTMWTIATRELRALFYSPLAWIILGVVQLILAFLFAKQVELFLSPSVQAQINHTPNALGLTDIVVGYLYVWAGMLFLLITPLLTMRLISEERRNKTLALLLSAPVSSADIILGKYCGLLLFYLLLMSLPALMSLSLLLGGHLDLGQLSLCVLGLGLLVAAMSAIGLYLSTLTQHPIIAAVGTFGCLLFLWIIDVLSDAPNSVLAYLSFANHYQPLLQGILNTQDIIYYLIMIGLFLLLSIWRLDNERVQ